MRPGRVARAVVALQCAAGEGEAAAEVPDVDGSWRGDGAAVDGERGDLGIAVPAEAGAVVIRETHRRAFVHSERPADSGIATARAIQLQGAGVDRGAAAVAALGGERERAGARLREQAGTAGIFQRLADGDVETVGVDVRATGANHHFAFVSSEGRIGLDEVGAVRRGEKRAAIEKHTITAGHAPVVGGADVGGVERSALKGDPQRIAAREDGVVDAVCHRDIAAVDQQLPPRILGKKPVGRERAAGNLQVAPAELHIAGNGHIVGKRQRRIHGGVVVSIRMRHEISRERERRTGKSPCRIGVGQTKGEASGADRLGERDGAGGRVENRVVARTVAPCGPGPVGIGGVPVAGRCAVVPDKIGVGRVRVRIALIFHQVVAAVLVGIAGGGLVQVAETEDFPIVRQAVLIVIKHAVVFIDTDNAHVAAHGSDDLDVAHGVFRRVFVVVVEAIGPEVRGVAADRGIGAVEEFRIAGRLRAGPLAAGLLVAPGPVRAAAERVGDFVERHPRAEAVAEVHPPAVARIGCGDVRIVVGDDAFREIAVGVVKTHRLIHRSDDGGLLVRGPRRIPGPQHPLQRCGGVFHPDAEVVDAGDVPCAVVGTGGETQETVGGRKLRERVGADVGAAVE